MAEAIVSFVAGKLGDLIMKEAQLLGGVGEQVRRVQTELINIRCYLRDADSKQHKGDASVENWLNQLRNVAYRIEDATDTFYLELEDDDDSLQKKKFRFFGKVKKMGHMAKKLPYLHKLGTKLGDIQKELEEIFKSKDKYGIKPLPDHDDRGSGQQRQEVQLPKRRAAYEDVDETEVVGLDADINNILQLLCSRQETPRRAVITIVGPGGLGKTTLARSVYNKAKADFKHHMMLSVSQQFSLIDLLRRMLRNLTAVPEDQKIDDVGYYVGELRRLLSPVRYLIILDDVWDDKLWDRLKNALPDDKNGSRVLMTSRSIDVAKSADSGMTPYELAFLNDTESLNLLLKKALPYQKLDEECDLQKLAKLLSKKCAGLPLALIVLGGILSTKDPTYHDWNKVFNTMDWHEEGKDCIQVLAMSYQDMPYNLKPCFLYLASFPEDYEIFAKDLIRMWIAEGFIPQQERKTLEEVAKIFLEQLFERSMLYVSSRHVDGSIEYCRVHDLIRDLAIREATNENFVTIFQNPKGVHCGHLGNRRASLQSDHCNEECLKCVGPNNRTLLWFVQFRWDSPKQSVEMVEFRLLRVLVIAHVKEIEITGLDRLIHLKYLKIEAAYLQLPIDFSWSRLKNLQTLDMDVPSIMNENGSPLEWMSLWTIGTLRHASVCHCCQDGPPPNADLRNLQTLYGVPVSWSWQKNQLPRLNNLQSLEICEYSESINWDGLAHLLGTLPHLLSLRIRVVCDIPKKIVYPRGLPNYENLQILSLYGPWSEDVTLDACLFPPHLLELKLRDSEFGQDPMPELGKLKGLKKLLLGFDVYKGGEEMICPSGFPVLQTLYLINLNIESFRIMEGVMPKLKHFQNVRDEGNRYIKISMPSELRHLSKSN